MSELIVPFRGSLIEGVLLPKADSHCGDIAVRAMTKVAQLLPDATKAKAFAFASVFEMNKVKDQCDNLSVLNALCNCAGLGLIPGGALAHAHFVPKRNKKKGIVECQLWVGYRGYIHLGYQTGFLKDVYADVVFEGESVEVWTDDTGKHIRHDTSSRLDLGQDGRPIRCAYTVWTGTGGGRGVETVPGKEIYDLQKSQGNVWNSNLVAMACKTPIRRAWRYWQVSGDSGNRLAYAARIDEQAERDEPQDRAYLIDDAVPEQAAGPAGLLDDLDDAPKRSESFERFKQVIESGDHLDGIADDVNAAQSAGDLDTQEAAILRSMVSP